MCSIGANLFGLGGSLQDTPPCPQGITPQPPFRVVTPSQAFTREISRLSPTYDSYGYTYYYAYHRSK